MLSKGFGAEVIDSGDGEVRLLVDGDTARYPTVGDGVLVVVDQTAIEDALTGLALAEHMGDVNRYLPDLCALLSLVEPTWSDRSTRWVMEWEENDAE